MKTSAANRSSDLLGMTREQLGSWFAERGEKTFRASQLMKWIYHRGVTDFGAMTDLGRGLRAALRETAAIRLPQIINEQHASDGARKWLLRFDDGNAVETVFIPENDRGTLCVSSQAGCALTCTFCSTARQGFNRNLTASEIIAQVFLAEHALRAERGQNGMTPPAITPAITNIVMMGMGEPLLNFEHVVAAMRLMLDDDGYGLGKRRVTLSTSGIIPAIDRLRETLDVSLAVSLHAPNNPLRDQLVPLNRKYPIEQLLAACRRYVSGKPRKQKLTFEYVMLDGVNDSPAQARELGELLRDWPAMVNLIPFNPFPGARYRRSSLAAIDAFRDVLMRGGIVTVTRRPRGEDIDAACGQLVGEVRDRSRREWHFARLEQRLST